MSLAMKVNPFAVPVVKMQEERHQRVIDTGIYALVRHPMYTGFLPFAVGPALWLESYAGLAGHRSHHSAGGAECV
jgi:protein-S-isoprenylcysteine O-methyltransferase Ste14